MDWMEIARNTDYRMATYGLLIGNLGWWLGCVRSYLRAARAYKGTL
jgi:hypothetical protein